jgi:Protein of unknown function (DUF1257)
MKTRKYEDSAGETVTLCATESGLKIIDVARRKKGWSCSDSELAQAANTSIETLNNFWQRLPVPREDFIAICYALGLIHWEQIAINHNTEDSHRAMRTRITDAEVLVKTLRDLNIDVEINGYLYVDYDLINFADVVAILKGQYDLGWRRGDDGYYCMIGSLIDIVRNYKMPDLINSINTSYFLNTIVLNIENQGIEWGLRELRQYAQNNNPSELVQLVEKLKLVPQLQKLGASQEQISDTFGLNI